MTSENIFLFQFYTSLFGEPRDPARELGNHRPQPHLGDRPEA